MPRITGTSEWLGENNFIFRRGDMSLMEFVESFPSAIADGEGPISGRFLRGHGSGKRVASKKALASLQSVDIKDLPENERSKFMPLALWQFDADFHSVRDLLQ